MTKIQKRLIVFFIGLPAVFSMIVFFPHRNHLLYNFLVLTFTFIAAGEYRNILAQKKLFISLPEAFVLGSIIPAAWILAVSFGENWDINPLDVNPWDFNPTEIVIIIITLGAFWILASQVFFAKKQLDTCVNRAAAGFSIMIYPGLFMGFMIRISEFRSADHYAYMYILLFLLLVFLNDSLAWVTGILFGKNNRGLVAASPNKSIAGFIGGQLFSVLTGIAALLLFSEVFIPLTLHPVLTGAILGFGTGLAGILGDLGESTLKRSSGVKDSGAVILGRGGALDSIDSLAMAAPVYYVLCRILFQL